MTASKTKTKTQTANGALGKRTGRTGRPPLKGLTPAQTRTLESIARLGMEHGYPPTFREVAEDVGTQHSSVYAHSLELRRKGMVLFEQYALRTLRLTDAGWTALK